MNIRLNEKEVLLSQLRYRYRREVKIDLIREFHEMDEENHVVPRLVVSLLEKHRRKLEVAFAIILGFLLGLASVPITYMISSFLS